MSPDRRLPIHAGQSARHRPARSGKTTVLQRVRDRLEAAGHRAGGVSCPEVRAEGERVGFEIVDISTGEASVLAHVDRETGPHVGKYRVDVDAVDAVCSSAFADGFDRADYLLVDEIAPVEVYSDVFVEGVRGVLDAEMPLVAAVHYRSTSGFIGEVKHRDDIEVFEVTDGARNDLPEVITERVLGHFEPDVQA